MTEDEPQGGTTLLGTEEPAAGTTQWHSQENSEMVTQKGWKTADDALKSYSELEKSFSGRVKLPTEQSTAEEKSSFYKSIGVPEGPEGYEIKDVPGNIVRNESAELALKGVAFEGGCPKATFEAIVKAFYDGESSRLIEDRTTSEATLKQEWSKPGQYDANVEIAQRAISELFGEEFKAILDVTGLGNNHIVIKAMYNAGLKMLSDTLIGGLPTGQTEEDKNWKPKSPNSPEMYRSGDDPESIKSRKWFEANTDFRY